MNCAGNSRKGSKTQESPQVTALPRSPERPVPSPDPWTPDCTQSCTPRLSHPLINSTQHHFLHSLTVPNLGGFCWRQRAEVLPWQRASERQQPQQRRRRQVKAAALWSLQPASLCSPVKAVFGPGGARVVVFVWTWAIQPQGSAGMKTVMKALTFLENHWVCDWIPSTCMVILGGGGAVAQGVNSECGRRQQTCWSHSGLRLLAGYYCLNV